MRLWGHNLEVLRIASGTIFNEVRNLLMINLYNWFWKWPTRVTKIMKNLFWTFLYPPCKYIIVSFLYRVLIWLICSGSIFGLCISSQLTKRIHSPFVFLFKWWSMLRILNDGRERNWIHRSCFWRQSYIPIERYFFPLCLVSIKCWISCCNPTWKG